MEQFKNIIELINFSVLDNKIKFNRQIYILFIMNNLRITRSYSYIYEAYILDNIMVDSINFKEDFNNIL